jgi:hypothetical protein
VIRKALLTCEEGYAEALAALDALKAELDSRELKIQALETILKSLKKLGWSSAETN